MEFLKHYKTCVKCNETKYTVDNFRFSKTDTIKISKCGRIKTCKSCEDKIKNSEPILGHNRPFGFRKMGDPYNPEYWNYIHIKQTLRGRINSIFKSKGIKKNSKSEKLLGCSFLDAKYHIQSLFKDDMNWENHGHGSGKWHIDHIKPFSTAKTESELIKVCHYTNLQPLWSHENFSKGGKYTEPEQYKQSA